MQRFRLPFTLIFISIFTIARAQDPGDQVFNENQVVTVELQFTQAGFWDSLVANYESETYMMADVTITDNSGINYFPGIGIRLKGNSSYGHPGDKKSFKIDFNRYDTLEYDGLKKLNFNNCFKDPTFMREKIYYEICEAAGINAPRANYANVYMNDEFWGFYEMVEQVDDEFLKTHFDDRSENLFKAGDAFGMGGDITEADLQYYGSEQADYEGMYTLENNTDENNWSDLIDLLDFINNTTDEEFASGLGDHFNISQLMNSMVMYNSFSNLDSYLNSARNYYIYNKDSSGVWEWINWDCNEAFGSYGGGPGTDDMTVLDIYYFSFNRPLFERILTIDETKSLYDSYYCTFRSNYFTVENINGIIDELYPLIQPHVYADYNKMYTNDNFETNINEDITVGGGPGGGTIYGLRSFTDARTAYIDEVLDCTQIEVEEKGKSDQINIYPNPASDFIGVYMSEIVTATDITILDMQGRILIHIFNMPANAFEINIQALTAGVYLLRIENENGIAAATFIKK